MKAFLFVVLLTHMYSAKPFVPEAWFETGIAILPADFAPKDTKGEDAVQKTDQVLVVADGVGSWVDTEGAKPDRFSKFLCKSVKDEHLKNDKITARDLLELGCLKAEEQFVGSASAVIVKLDKNEHEQEKFVQTMSTAQLGDPGYSIFRTIEAIGQSETEENKMILDRIFMSEEQNFRFNYPHQCGTAAKHITRTVERSHELQDGDLVVLYTDGLTDNIFSDDIFPCLNKHALGQDTNLKQAATCLTH